MKKHLNASRHVFAIGEERLPIIVKRHPSSRRIVIRYQPLLHSIGLTLPRYASLRQGLRFIEERRGWIIRQLEERPKKLPFAEGEIIPCLGKSYRLRHTGGRGVVSIEGEEILVTGERAFMARRVRDWLILRAREEINRLAAAKAAQIGKTFSKINLRDTVSHWGSCSHAGGLSFSWRLIFAPPAVLDYVVCHEVAHLAEHNHSKAFWDVVEQLCPDYGRHRNWLKGRGSELYIYG